MQQEAVTQFKNQLRGNLVEPADTGYEEACKVYNAMISRKPRLIAKCADVADVITAVGFGRQNDLRVSIRGGGHNAEVWESVTTAWSSTSPLSSTFMSIQQQGLCVWGAAALGAISTTQRMPLDSLSRPESSRRPASGA
jgi:hypothetical protein